MSEPTDEKGVYLRALFTIANADGEVSPSELETITEIARRMGRVEDDLGSIRPSSLSRAARTIIKDEYRRAFLGDAVAVASADGVLQGDELRCIKFLCEAWKVEPPPVAGVSWKRVQGMDPRKSDRVSKVDGSGRRTGSGRDRARGSGSTRAAGTAAGDPVEPLEAEAPGGAARVFLVTFAVAGLAGLLESVFSILASSAGSLAILAGATVPAVIMLICGVAALVPVALMAGKIGARQGEAGIGGALGVLVIMLIGLSRIAWAETKTADQAITIALGVVATIGAFGLAWALSGLTRR